MARTAGMARTARTAGTAGMAGRRASAWLRSERPRMRRDEQGLPVSSCEAWSGFSVQGTEETGARQDRTRDVRTEPDSAAKPIGFVHAPCATVVTCSRYRPDSCKRNSRFPSSKECRVPVVEHDTLSILSKTHRATLREKYSAATPRRRARCPSGSKRVTSRAGARRRGDGRQERRRRRRAARLSRGLR